MHPYDYECYTSSNSLVVEILVYEDDEDSKLMIIYSSVMFVCFKFRGEECVLKDGCCCWLLAWYDGKYSSVDDNKYVGR